MFLSIVLCVLCCVCCVLCVVCCVLCVVCCVLCAVCCVLCVAVGSDQDVKDTRIIGAMYGCAGIGCASAARARKELCSTKPPTRTKVPFLCDVSV